MAAVLGLDNETVISLTEQMNNVYVANYNSPGQVVITGDKEEINNNLDKFKTAGAKRVIPLAVSGAFHSPLIKKAEIEFSKFVNQFNFNNSNIPVYTNVGVVEFRLCGIIIPTTDKWVIHCLFAKGAQSSDENVSESGTNELTPAGKMKQNEKKKKRK